MAKRKKDYNAFAFAGRRALIVGGADFAVYLIAAGTGILWLKVLTAILGFAISLGLFTMLVLSKEAMRPRSRWMTVAAAGLALCLLVSLLLNYPSPNPYKNIPTAVQTSANP